MVTIPDHVPSSLDAGDRWQWTFSNADYPASSWTVTWYFRGPSIFSVAATADGDDHAVSIAATDSAGYKAGTYQWAARAVNGSDVVTVGSGYVVVRPNFADSSVDPRSFNQRALEALEAVIENRATTDQLSVSISGRAISRMSWDEVLRAYDHFKNRVASELGSSPSEIFVRFGRP